MSILENFIVSTNLSVKILKALGMAIAVNYLLYRYHIIYSKLYVNLYQVANCSNMAAVELQKIQNLISIFIKLKEIQKII